MPGVETPDADSGSRFPLALISRKQHLRFLNANYGGFEKHLPSEGEPLLQIHESDAAHRGIESGDRVTVFNDRGSLTLATSISSDVQPGVVAIPFGWWNRSNPNGRSVNVLTNPTTPTDDNGSAAFHDTLVEVQPVVG
jgi:anaerobic selenocysteine-containing dehydrogenase